MSEQEFRDKLRGILDGLCYLDAEDRAEVEGAIGAEVFEVEEVETFEDAGVLTNNKGLVVRLAGGATFQITIVQDHRS
jgi:hypothetical protein